MKFFLIVFVVLVAKSAIGADSSSVVYLPIPDLPIRDVLDDGTPIPPEQIDKIHQKDLSPWGWMYDWEEWDHLWDGIPVVPEYYYDESRQQNNGGFSIG